MQPIDKTLLLISGQLVEAGLPLQSLFLLRGSQPLVRLQPVSQVLRLRLHRLTLISPLGLPLRLGWPLRLLLPGGLALMLEFVLRWWIMPLRHTLRGKRRSKRTKEDPCGQP